MFAHDRQLGAQDLLEVGGVAVGDPRRQDPDDHRWAARADTRFSTTGTLGPARLMADHTRRSLCVNRVSKAYLPWAARGSRSSLIPPPTWTPSGRRRGSPGL